MSIERYCLLEGAKFKKCVVFNLNVSHFLGSAQKEIQFIEMCMSHLRFACEASVDTQLSASLMCIQRAIVILRSHIDAFRRR